MPDDMIYVCHDVIYISFGLANFLLLLLVFNCDLPQCCDNFGLCSFCMLETWPLPPLASDWNLDWQVVVLSFH